MKTKPIGIKDVSDAQRYQALKLYTEGMDPVDVAKQIGHPHKVIKNFIAKFYREITTAKELKALASTHSALPRYLNTYRKPTYICDTLMQKVEEEDADMVYAYAYHATKDNCQALKEAGLYHLNKTHGAQKVNDNAHKLKGQFLRSIPRVKEELARLREDSLKDANVSPDLIQIQLLEQLEQLNSHEHLEYKERALLLRTLELLGKTTSAFSENITIETVSPSDALDKLIEMTEAKTIKPQGTYVMGEE